jgi:signal transduction histidine kinase
VNAGTIGRVNDSWRVRFVTGRGPWGLAATDLVLLAFAAVFLMVAATSAFRFSDETALTVVGMTAAVWAPLLLTARWPVTALLLVVAAECLRLVLVPLLDPVEFTSIPVATMVATYSVAVRRDWRTAWIAGAAAAGALLVVGLLARPSSQLAANMFALDLVLVATGAGVLLRSRHHRLLALERRAVLAEQTREEEARRQVAAERLRMARELHDVVAHNLALVNAQSGVAEYLLRSDPEAAAKALHDITHHTRQALDELRATVGLLRQVEDPLESDGPDGLRPVPGLADLDDLVAVHTAAGAVVTVTVDGEPQPLTALSGLAAFRIAQEALTNAAKHAPGAVVEVRLGWSESRLEVRVENAPLPPSQRGHRGPGTGHGLVGMRERALATGGSLHTGHRPDGGFVVAAVIPVDTKHDQEEPSPS